jgi:hypothetical protein
LIAWPCSSAIRVSFATLSHSRLHGIPTAGSPFSWTYRHVTPPCSSLFWPKSHSRFLSIPLHPNFTVPSPVLIILCARHIDSLCMYTRCFFLNCPDSSCTFCANPRWTFLAVTTSTRGAPRPGVIDATSDVQRRKSWERVGSVFRASISTSTPFSRLFVQIWEESRGDALCRAAPTHPCDVRCLALYFALLRCPVCESW